MVPSGMLRRVALVRTDGSGGLVGAVIRGARIGVGGSKGGVSSQRVSVASYRSRCSSFTDS
jgi:hypothetical protein